ncbi:hypothetical protein FVE85_8678 [Porphyridium purpureum]|uniref:OTU domain-containing protein n=1 Tax=Porphyridium purpureum TaxID=35688 RepID=A0A5J4YR20_PORPP|nr:hypothetical protein FVE85_8678 [Porphyridium purpureum]|eukprot:POR5874..scf296_7
MTGSNGQRSTAAPMASKELAMAAASGMPGFVAPVQQKPASIQGMDSCGGGGLMAVASGSSSAAGLVPALGETKAPSAPSTPTHRGRASKGKMVAALLRQKCSWSTLKPSLEEEGRRFTAQLGARNAVVAREKLARIPGTVLVAECSVSCTDAVSLSSYDYDAAQLGQLLLLDRYQSIASAPADRVEELISLSREFSATTAYALNDHRSGSVTTDTAEMVSSELHAALEQIALEFEQRSGSVALQHNSSSVTDATGDLRSTSSSGPREASIDHMSMVSSFAGSDGAAGAAAAAAVQQIQAQPRRACAVCSGAAGDATGLRSNRATGQERAASASGNQQFGRYAFYPTKVDGNCGFSAIASSMNMCHSTNKYTARGIRRELMLEVKENRALYESLGKRNAAFGMCLQESGGIDAFLNRVLDEGISGHWLGERLGDVELLALARRLKVVIEVFTFQPRRGFRTYQKLCGGKMGYVGLLYTGPSHGGHFDLLRPRP